MFTPRGQHALLVLIFVSLLSLPGLSKPSLPQTAGEGRSGRPIVGSGQPYVIKPGDELSITFLAQPDNTTTVQVRQDGSFYIPPLGDVVAAGKTLAELRSTLRKLTARQFQYPDVAVGLKSVRRVNCLVMGEVARPGQYEVLPNTTLLEVIADAGGATSVADQRTATIMRGGSATEVPLAPSDSARISIEPEDVVFVRKAPRITLTGEVNAPGLETMSEGPVTAWQCLAIAGGAKPDAALGRIQLRRFGSTGEILILDLSAGSTSAAAGTVLADGDELIVPQQQILILGNGGNSKSGLIPISGPEPIIQALGEAGVDPKSRLSKVVLINSEDLSASKGQIEPHMLHQYDLASALSGTSHSQQLPTVKDGDVIIIETASPPANLATWVSTLPALAVIRTLFK